MDSLIQPQRHTGLNMGLSQISPGFRNLNITSTTQHPDTDSVPHGGYDFHRMLQQHLSEGASTPYRSTLHNIKENEQDEMAGEREGGDATHPNVPPNVCASNAMCTSFTGIRHREGPMNVSHDQSLFHSLYGQTGGYEPLTNELTTADMCLSTLYLHELYHRQNRRRGVHLQSSQQHLWQLPHQQPTNLNLSQSSVGGGNGSGTGVDATFPLINVPSSTSSSSTQQTAAEKTPLLNYQKKT